jgi:radical SAM superfamily enzyme YgiQ (UPF0313 family)
MLNVWGIQIQGYTFVLPASIGQLWAYLSTKKDISSHIKLGGIGARYQETVMEVLDELEETGPPDIVLVSMYLWNKNKSNKLTREIKKRYPQCVIIVGGNEVPQNTERLQIFVQDNPQYDYIVWSEGEIALENIVRKILSQKNIYHSFYYDDCFCQVKDGKIVSKNTKKRYLPHKVELDLPSPYLMGIFDGLLDRYRDVHTMAILETNRGCMYSCTFCDWGLEEKLRKFTLDRVKKEFAWMAENVDEIYIADANFGILDRDIEIAKHFVISKIKAKNPRFKSIIFSYAKNAKEKVLKIAEYLEVFDISRSGATFALQSLHPPTLEAIKRQNMAISTDYKWIAERFVEKGIPYSSEMILGLPLETKESFFEGLNQLLELNPFIMNTYKLQLLENSEMGKDNHSLQYGMRFDDFPQNPSDFADEIETSKMVIETGTMPIEDMREVRKIRDLIEILWMARSAYFVGRYLQKERDVKTCDFIRDLDSWFSKNNKVFWDNFLKSKEDVRGNSAEKPPMYYDFRKFKFHRYVNAWCYLQADLKRKQIFYENLESFCAVNYDVDPKLLKDLIKFNMEMIPDCRVQNPNKFDLQFNWIQYFMDGNLEKIDTEVEVELPVVGTGKHTVNEDNESVFYYLAGGHDFLFVKQNTFMYNAGFFKNNKQSKVEFYSKLGKFYRIDAFQDYAWNLLDEILEDTDISKEYAMKKLFQYKV